MNTCPRASAGAYSLRAARVAAKNREFAIPASANVALVIGALDIGTTTTSAAATATARIAVLTALASVTGVYLITDTRDGRQHVGKADGAGSIRQRWSAYAAMTTAAT